MTDDSMALRLDGETRQRLQDVVNGRHSSASAAIVDAINKRWEALHDGQLDAGHADEVKDNPACPYDSVADPATAGTARKHRREATSEDEALDLIFEEMTGPGAPPGHGSTRLRTVARSLSREALKDKELQAQIRRSQLGRLSRGALLVTALLTVVMPLLTAGLIAIGAVNGNFLSGLAAAYHAFKGNISPDLAIGVLAALFTANGAINVALAVNISSGNRMDKVHETRWRADLTKVAGATAITAVAMSVMYTIGGTNRNVATVFMVLTLDLVLLLSDSLTPRGVGQWLHAKNRLLNSERPVDLLTEDRYHEVHSAAEAFVAGSLLQPT